MSGTPFHYDGSVQLNEALNASSVEEPFELTDEMRLSISGNPFVFEINE